MIDQSALINVQNAVLVLSHPRSGTHLTIDFLRKNFIDCRSWKFPLERLSGLYLPIDALFIEDSTWDESDFFRTYRRANVPILKSHWLTRDYENLADVQPHLAAWIRQHAKRLYVVRHPVAVLASLFAYENQETFKPTDEWLSNRVNYWMAHVERWIGVEFLLKYEDIVQRPQETRDRLAAYLELGAPGSQHVLPGQMRSRFRSRLARLFSIVPDSTAIVATRKYPGWQQLFSSEQLDFIAAKTVTQRDYFGYESRPM